MNWQGIECMDLCWFFNGISRPIFLGKIGGCEGIFLEEFVKCTKSYWINWWPRYSPRQMYRSNFLGYSYSTIILHKIKSRDYFYRYCTFLIDTLHPQSWLNWNNCLMKFPGSFSIEQKINPLPHLWIWRFIRFFIKIFSNRFLWVIFFCILFQAIIHLILMIFYAINHLSISNRQYTNNYFPSHNCLHIKIVCISAFYLVFHGCIWYIFYSKSGIRKVDGTRFFKIFICFQI
jgi:hypothetical protein